MLRRGIAAHQRRCRLFYAGRAASTAFPSALRFDDVRLPLRQPTHPQLVPVVSGAAHLALLQQAESMLHFRWLAQKHVLGQDAYLLGDPGAYKLLLALRFAQVAAREIELVSLSPDTAENDLKQRREIERRPGEDAVGVEWHDEPVVRAAVAGRILVLDGLERAERNVLPLVNNLLESREMQLEDGRCLISAARYDELSASDGGHQALQRAGLVRVHPDFRVLALGIPCPPYKGNALDPPLRSRLQGRRVANPLPETVLAALVSMGVPAEAAKRLAVLNDVLARSEVSAGRLDSLAFVDVGAAIVRDGESAVDVVQLLSRYLAVSQGGGGALSEQQLADAAKECGFASPPAPSTLGNTQKAVEVDKRSEVVLLPEHEQVLEELARDVGVGRSVLLTGDRGVGKRTMVKLFTQRQDRSCSVFTLYKDMLARDLFQRRHTNDEGETVWQDSPLIAAAKTGGVALLDGMDRVPNLLPSLQPLLSGGILSLPDGSRLIPAATYEQLQREGQANLERVHAIHPRFLCIGIGEGDFLAGDAKSSWSVRELEELDGIRSTLLSTLVPEAGADVREALQRFARLLKERKEHIGDFSGTFTFRQLLRAARTSVASHGNISVVDSIKNSMLYRFMPRSEQAVLDELLEEAGVSAIATTAGVGGGMEEPPLEKSAKEAAAANHLVPSVRFHQNDFHTKLLADMSAAWSLGDPLLLIGPQGTGKNFLIDHFLGQRGIERRYFQLHRDITIGSLWVTNTIESGRIVTKESPLVTALRHGGCCVLDEVDKASPEVTATLRALVDGWVTLPDGRLVVSSANRRFVSDDQPQLAIHPNFRLVCLANRPGWPFQGNDFAALCGDLFFIVPVAPHRDEESFLDVLRPYGPSVSADKLNSIASSFAELQEKDLAYPFSLREAVNVVKHLERFPQDRIESALDNVFSFDVFSSDILRQASRVFKKHGIEIGSGGASDAEHGALGSVRVEYEYENERDGRHGPAGPKHGKDPDGNPHVGGNTWAGGTGGFDTAGLGGSGGPYRLDLGHDVHQISEAQKRWVSEEAKERARKMAEEGLQRKLREIGMGKVEYETYQRLFDRVRPEVQSLQRLLDAVEGSSRENAWLRHQAEGELDEAKLVEGLVGERNVYKRRGNPSDSAFGEKKPLRIRFLFDVSGSMYRFNGMDGRLQRSMEAAILIMEAFDRDRQRFQVEVYGHSGDSAKVELLPKDITRMTRKEKFAVLERMVANSQYTWPGDNTFRATKEAIEELSKSEETDNFLFTISDANFSRYNLSAAQFGEILLSKRNVRASSIFIASMGSEAQQLSRQLPPGHAFVCTDTAELPSVVSEFLKSAIERR